MSDCEEGVLFPYKTKKEKMDEIAKAIVMLQEKKIANDRIFEDVLKQYIVEFMELKNEN